MIQKILETFKDLVFPKICFGCKQRGNYLCVNCLEKIPPPRETKSEVIAAFDYKNKTVKHLLWQLKYEQRYSIALTLAKALYDKLLEDITDLKTLSPTRKTKIIVIPVPMHPDKLRKRGFNQAELIAKELASLDPASFILKTDVLEKTKDTISQMTIKDRSKRLQNVEGSFRLKNGGTIAGRFVLLVDDITTTGATINECKDLLITARPIKVVAVSVAH